MKLELHEDRSPGEAPEPRSNGAVSFRQLKLLEAVGRLGSVSRAAAECGVTQPAATQALAVLARKGGFAVLEVGARGSALTPAGRRLHASAVLLIAKLERAFQFLDAARREEIVWRISQAHMRLIGAMLERGSLERGATVLAFTPRAAKRTIATLEALIGRALVTREQGDHVLTADGRALARDIGLIPAEMEWLLGEIRATADQALRTIVIGAAPEPGIASLTAVVEAQARQSTACLEVFETGQSDLLARLAIGEVDIVVGHITGSAGADIEWEEISSARYRIVARHGHPLAARRRIALRELAEHSWVFGARGSERRAASDALFATGPQPHCSLITSAPPLMARLMAGSDTLALMTDQELSRYDTITPLAHPAPATPVRIGLATRSGWQVPPLHAHLVKLIKDHFAGPTSGDDLAELGEPNPGS